MARRVPPDLKAAAQIHAAREEVLLAVGRLAAEPLNVVAADQMRAALDGVESPEVRAALRELRPARRRALCVVGGGDAPGPPSPSLRSLLVGRRLAAVEGGAA